MKRSKSLKTGEKSLSLWLKFMFSCFVCLNASAQQDSELQDLKTEILNHNVKESISVDATTAPSEEIDSKLKALSSQEIDLEKELAKKPEEPSIDAKLGVADATEPNKIEAKRVESIKPTEESSRVTPLTNINELKIETEEKQKEIVQEPVTKEKESTTAKVQVPTKKEKESVKIQSPKDSKPDKAILTKTNELQKQLAASLAREKKLIEDLDSLRSRLLVAETEVERLTVMLGGKMPREIISQKKISTEESIDVTSIKPISEITATRVNSDIPIATISAIEVPLRTSPGNTSSVITTLRQGAKVAVESRQGAWTRVITSSGLHAWLPTYAISNRAAGSSSSSSKDSEEVAFESLSKGLK